MKPVSAETLVRRYCSKYRCRRFINGHGRKCLQILADRDFDPKAFRIQFPNMDLLEAGEWAAHQCAPADRLPCYVVIL